MYDIRIKLSSCQHALVYLEADRSWQVSQCIAEQFLGLRGLQTLCQNRWVQWPGSATRSTIPADSSNSLQTGEATSQYSYWRGSDQKYVNWNPSSDRCSQAAGYIRIIGLANGNRTIAMLIFSCMNPPCPFKTDLAGTTPIGRRDEEEEVVGNRQTEVPQDFPDTRLNIGQMKASDPNFHFRKASKMKLRCRRKCWRKLTIVLLRREEGSSWLEVGMSRIPPIPMYSDSRFAHSFRLIGCAWKWVTNLDFAKYV